MFLLTASIAAINHPCDFFRTCRLEGKHEVLSPKTQELRAMKSHTHAISTQKRKSSLTGTYCLPAVVFLLFLFSGSPKGWAQSNLGGISGIVADTTGAVIAEATVTATNDATGVVATTKSTTAGLYDFPALQPGTYRLEVKQPSFKSLSRENV
jgi:Carboxypeptidase regulatory-like domain